jgi:hypothetical protein
MTVLTNNYNQTAKKVTIIITGQTYNCKEDLKKLGFKFSDDSFGPEWILEPIPISKLEELKSKLLNYSTILIRIEDFNE